MIIIPPVEQTHILQIKKVSFYYDEKITFISQQDTLHFLNKFLFVFFSISRIIDTLYILIFVDRAHVKRKVYSREDQHYVDIRISYREHRERVEVHHLKVFRGIEKRMKRFHHKSNYLNTFRTFKTTVYSSFADDENDENLLQFSRAISPMMSLDTLFYSTKEIFIISLTFIQFLLVVLQE